MQYHSFAGRFMQPACHRNIHTVLMMREVLGDRSPHTAMSRLEMKRFSPSANILGHCDAVYCLAVNSMNTVVLTGSDDLRVKAWSICPRIGVGLISTMRGHQGVICEVMFNPQDESIAISSDNSFCAVRFWHIANGQQLRLIISHEYNGREDVFFGLQNCMDKYLVTTTRNEIKFWSFSTKQQRLSLDDRGDPEQHVPEFGITFPLTDKAKHIGIVALHPSLPFALVATDAGTLYLISMLPNAGTNQFLALKYPGKDGKDPFYSKEITELSWNSCGTRFVVAGKNWDSNVLIVPFKFDSARCFVAAATGLSKEEAIWSRETAPKRDPGSKSSGPKRIYMESLVGTKDIQRLDLKALDESIISQEKFEDTNRLTRNRGRSASTGYKEITCISWSREGARLIVGCCATSLIFQSRTVTISKSTVRVFCALSAALLVAFDNVHDRPISSIIPHPSQFDIFMTASYDGDVKICDMSSMRLEVLNGTAPGFEDAVCRVPSLPFNVSGCKVIQTFNGKPQISDARWQSNDTIVVARKSGHISLFNTGGFVDPIHPKDRAMEVHSARAQPAEKKWRCRVWGCSSADQVLPEDHFYEFERRKLEWDSWGTPVDQVTKARTHEMPRGPLCNRHFESYEAFGFYAGVWEQAAIHVEEQPQIFNGGAAIHDEDDDEILVQPLPVGAGRRLVDSSSSESEDLCVTLMLLTSFLNINPDIFRRYAVSDDTEESDSEKLSSNDDSSEHSSGDDSDVYERRHSTVLKRSIFLHCADCTYLNAAPSRSTRKQEIQIIG
jgi:WD40 repeat protein